MHDSKANAAASLEWDKDAIYQEWKQLSEAIGGLPEREAQELRQLFLLRLRALMDVFASLPQGKASHSGTCRVTAPVVRECRNSKSVWDLLFDSVVEWPEGTSFCKDFYLLLRSTIRAFGSAARVVQFVVGPPLRAGRSTRLN